MTMSATVADSRALTDDRPTGLLRSYLYAGSVGSGPWVVSILAILAISHLGDEFPPAETAQFQVIVTYLIAFSLILAGPLQLLFARFASDRIYQKCTQAIIPNLFGALIVMLLTAAVVGAAVLQILPGSIVLRVWLLASFTTLCAIWLTTMFVSAVRAPFRILGAFVIGYCLSVGVALALQDFGLEGLLAGFTLGQGVLLFLLLAPSRTQYAAAVSFEFLSSTRLYPSLLLTGLLYPLALWCDKFIFWFTPSTSDAVYGPLRASPIYDTPIFLAYLSIIPGMMVFQARMDNDITRSCTAFFRGIEQGDSLAMLQRSKQMLVVTMRDTLLQILKVQGIATFVLIGFSGELLAWFGISPWYRPLLNVDLLAAYVQLFFLAVLNLLFFLDKRRAAVALCGLFVCANTLFTLMTQYLGPTYYGFGFLSAAALSVLVGLAVLSRKLDRLEYETFMLQQAAV
jgi:uncharacterized membrane protein